MWNWVLRVFLLSLAAAGVATSSAIPPGANVRAFTLVVEREQQPLIGKSILTINGTSPGPELRVTEGDWLRVTVINALADDNTTLHWHGMRQRHTPYSDGVPAATQCPIGHGSTNTLVYEFEAFPSGTYWYHGTSPTLAASMKF